MSRIAALILAAGGSSRMGTPKQFLTLGGRSFIRIVVDRAREAGCEPVVVVGGADVDRVVATVGNDAHVVSHPDWARGIGSSIRAGMEAIELEFNNVDHVLLLLADQPNVGPREIHRLVAEADDNFICAAQFADTIGPPVLIPRAFFDALRGIPDDRGAKDLWLSHPDRLRRVPLQAAARDIDTPTDYESLCRDTIPERA